MASSENGLTNRQQRAIAALLASRSIADAAQAVDVTDRTLYRWMQIPEFKAALASAEGELIDGATRRLLQLQDAAITTVALVMADEKYSPTVRLRAAGIVLDHLLKLRELRNVEQRLAALEATIAKQPQSALG